MIYVTGDLHGDIDIGKLSSKRFPAQKGLTRNDYVIVCGDFGLPWRGDRTDDYWLTWLSSKPFTTLFVDGNHENFGLLDRIPETPMFGGMVQAVRPNVYHLMRGHVYEIGGKTFFAMGGATSQDREYRVEGISWWPREMPSEREMAYATATLERCGWRVDYVLTHCAPRCAQGILSPDYAVDPLNEYLQRVQDMLDYGHWYCGHYHRNVDVGDTFHVLYDSIVPLHPVGGTA